MKPVRMRWSGIALALGLALLVTNVAYGGQRHHRAKAKPAVKKSRPWTGAENSLVGIKLYDSGLHVIDVYGTPDDIQALSFSGTGGGGGGMGGGMGGPAGMGGGGGRGMGPGGPPRGFGAPPGSGGGGMPPGVPPGAGRGRGGGQSDFFGPFDTGAITADQAAPGVNPQLQQGGGGGAPGMPPMGGMGGKGGGVPGLGGGEQDRVTFTRWVYDREGCRYAFIIDKVGHVVQIEAIGIDDNRVKTKRGVGFGATFAQIIRSYDQPDGYEIGGENLMVKYLVHDNVAFRLARLGTKKPQVVTGIVVAAGKS